MGNTRRAIALRVYLLTFGGIFFLTSSMQLIRFFTDRDDIWWTPMTSPLSLGEAHDRVEVYVRGEPLERALRSGRLQLALEGRALTTADVGIRVNNRDPVRLKRLPVVVAAAAGAGFSGLIFFFCLASLIPSRPTKSAE